MISEPKESSQNSVSAMLTCSVVVCTRDRPQALDECLAAISTGTNSATDVIVVDSAPKYARAEQVASRWGARYIFESHPGVSRARNRALSESTSDILAFVDDDAIPESGWLDPLLAEFADPEVAIATGRVLPPDADSDMLPVYAWFGIMDLGPERRVFDRTVQNWYELTNFGGIGLGANVTIRRSVFDHWKGFDERLGAGASIPGHEELKAFFDLIERGYRIVYTPYSVVRHAFPRSLEQLRQRALRSIEASAAYLALLLSEQPAHRKETWGYIKSKLKRVSPIYHRGTGKGQALIPGYRVMIARLKGVSLYFATRLSGQGVGGH